jgi:hypothetical protein
MLLDEPWAWTLAALWAETGAACCTWPLDLNETRRRGGNEQRSGACALRCGDLSRPAVHATVAVRKTARFSTKMYEERGLAAEGLWRPQWLGFPVTRLA